MHVSINNLEINLYRFSDLLVSQKEKISVLTLDCPCINGFSLLLMEEKIVTYMCYFQKAIHFIRIFNPFFFALVDSLSCPMCDVLLNKPFQWIFSGLLYTYEKYLILHYKWKPFSIWTQCIANRSYMLFWFSMLFKVHPKFMLDDLIICGCLQSTYKVA